MSTFVTTVLLSLIISLLFKPILLERYLMPACGVFWFATSILIGKLENKKLFSILLVIIFIIGLFGISGIISSTQDNSYIGVQNQDILDEINNSNSTVICIGDGSIIRFGTYLNESKVIVSQKSKLFDVDHKYWDKIFDIKFSNDLNKTINENNNTKIYVITGSYVKNDLINNSEPYYSIARNNFYEIN